MQAKIPNLFIVGVPKAGTTSLYFCLDQHPDIYLPSNKEPHFFTDISPSKKFAPYNFPYIKSKEEYLKLFEKVNNQKIIADASTSYFWSKTALTNIFKFNSNAKIIIMLRNPINRAFSHYLNDLREGVEDRTFFQAIVEDFDAEPKGFLVSHLYVDQGLYFQLVKNYLDLFGAENVLILFFEEFIINPQKNLDNIFSFLEIDTLISQEIKIEKSNVYSVHKNKLFYFLFSNPSLRSFLRNVLPRPLRIFARENLIFSNAKKPAIDQDSYLFLKNIYNDDSQKLKLLLNRDIPWEL